MILDRCSLLCPAGRSSSSSSSSSSLVVATTTILLRFREADDGAGKRDAEEGVAGVGGGDGDGGEVGEEGSAVTDAAGSDEPRRGDGAAEREKGDRTGEHSSELGSDPIIVSVLAERLIACTLYNCNTGLSGLLGGGVPLSLMPLGTRLHVSCLLGPVQSNFGDT